MSLTKAFRAGFVRRWHMNPDLCHTVDPDDGHQGRVARIVLMLHPNPSIRLFSALLTHDDGESTVGDIKAPSKDANPVFAATLERMESQTRLDIWGTDYVAHLTDTDRDWLKFADRLDAFMWAKHHAPHVMDSDDWPEARQRLIDAAICFGVLGQVADILESEVTA